MKVTKKQLENLLHGPIQEILSYIGEKETDRVMLSIKLKIPGRKKKMIIIVVQEPQVITLPGEEV